MTATLPKPASKRHAWTKDELAHLNRSVSHAKNKSAAFKKVADEMGLKKSTVAAQYYNLHTKPKAAPAKVVAAMKKQSPVQVGRPFDFTSCSERELIELRQAITFEVNRRIESLNELIKG